MSDEFWSGFNNGFGAVNALRKNQALAQYKQNPEAGYNALMGVDPEMALQIKARQREDELMKQRQNLGQMASQGDFAGAQTQAYKNGDFEGAQHFAAAIANKTEAEKAKIKDHAAKVSNLLYALKNIPPEQRQGWLQQNAASIQAMNISPNEISTDDHMIELGLSQAIGVDKMLDNDRMAQTAQSQAAYRDALINQGQQKIEQKAPLIQAQTTKALRAPAGKSGGSKSNKQPPWTMRF